MAKKNELRTIKPNTIAEARGGMSKAFLDILDISMQKVVETDESPDNLDYDFFVKDYEEQFGLQFNKNAFRKLRKAIHDTMKTDSLLTINLKEGHEIDYFVFQEVEFIEADGRIHVVFTRRFKKILIELLEQKGKKIYYSLPDTLQMNSEYSKKFYPILLERVHKTENDRMLFSAFGSLHNEPFDRIETIENFRELLSIPKSYAITQVKNTCNLIVAEIEAYTPYHAEVYYNTIPSRSRYPKITHICWRIILKPKVTNINPEAKSYKLAILDFLRNTNINLTEKEALIIANDALKNKVSITDVKQRLGYAAKKKNINNIVGYIRALMKEYSSPKEIKNSFINIPQHDYDFDELEKILLKRR